jgi:flagellar basal-body rod protein FlgB
MLAHGRGMAGTGISILDAIGAKLKHLAVRQQVIAANIAHANTPGYRARDVAAPDFSSMLGTTSKAGGAEIAVPRVQVSASLTRLGASPARLGEVRSGGPGYEVKESGNSVILEEELMKQAEVQIDYAAMTNLYRKQVSMLKIALGRGQ